MKTNDQLEPNVFVIFGGAADLTWRKLVPALFDLSQDRSTPADYSVIAVDRVDLSDQKLRQRLHDGVKKFSRHGNVKTGVWREFASHIHYQEAFAVRLPDAYETLPGDVMKNDATLFMRADQVEAAESGARIA